MNGDGSVVPGSARGSRAGEGGPLSRTFLRTRLSFGSILPEVRFGEPPKPAREPRALPDCCGTAGRHMKTPLEKLGLTDDNAGVFDGEWRGGGATIDKISPIDGRRLAGIRTASDDDYNKAISRAHEAFLKWRVTPGPVRGETVRRLGNALRELKHELGQLVTLETGKIIAEGEGEVQEMIDICDFAVGQSRMLYGLTIQSERPSHRLMEQWHPLGVVAVITAFNFPVAVWSWNAALAAVCGDATIWKPSEKTPLTAIAVTKIAERVCRETGADPAIFTLLVGDRKTVGQKLADDPHIPLVSATGSTNMGFNVAKAVNGRLGRTILELGGNNALIVTPSADLGDGGAIDLFRRRGHSGTALYFDTPGDHARVSCIESPR